MYEEHFGLEKRPFSVKATGTEVFVGPQTAKTMEGFRKALAVQDAVVTVSGSVGTGKTTLVERALAAIGSKYKTIRVGRVKMNSSDILEALLIVLGVQERPSGTIQRFAALRRKLQQLQDAGTRVFVLVEDAVHAGAETLAELEALTDAQAGESDGAGIVLMGDERLFDFMRQPELARLQQRIRRRHKIQALCVPEMLGYLKHSFRIAGGDYVRIFDDRSAELFHHLSEGIPRVVNNLVDAVLVAAAKAGLDRIPATFIAEIAAEEFGLEADGFDFSVPESPGDVAPEPAEDDAPEPVADVPPQTAADSAAGLAEDVPAEPASAPAQESLAGAAAEPAGEMPAEPAFDAEPEAVAEPSEGPVVDAASEPEVLEELAPGDDASDEADAPPEESDDVPHLINDTLPDLSILSQRYATLSQEDFDKTRGIGAEAEDVNRDAESGAVTADQAVEQSVADVAQEADTLVNIDPECEPELKPEPLAGAIPDVTPTLEPPVEGIPEPEAESGPSIPGIPVLEAETEPAADKVPVLEAVPQSSPEPVAEFTTDFEARPTAEAKAEAELIPELEPVLRAEPGPAAERAPEAGQQPDLEVVPDNPALEAANSIDQPDSHDETPEWDRDPTFAQLKPDLDALEQAMAYTHGEILDSKPQTMPETESPTAAIEEHEELPEITLDKSIETGIQNQLCEESAGSEPPQRARKSDVELGQIAANIANAKTIDDIDDIMAETLFGTSISMVAAAIKANPPGDGPSNDELQLVEEAPTADAVPPVPESPAARPVREEISIETPLPAGKAGPDPSASQRLKTVRALNADRHRSLREPSKAAPAASPPPASDEPQPIEDQINTSITQTLQALQLPPETKDEETEEEQKSGFFSRFRRSK